MLTTRQIQTLRTGVEQALGFSLAEFRLLKGGSSPNFKAVRARDAFPFLVKLLPPTRAWSAPLLVAHLDEMRGTKCVQRVFSEAPEKVGEFRLICLEWCEGTRKFPYQLTDAELAAFVTFYTNFSQALQRATHVVGHDPLPRWRARILACRGWLAAPLRRLVEREIEPDDADYRPEYEKVIFGDFHHGNILFQAGEVAHILDLESFSHGYATDDLVRYFTCAYDHAKWKKPFVRAAMLRAFAQVVRLFPATRHEWMVSFNAQILQALQDIPEHASNPLSLLNLFVRVQFYLALRSVAKRNLQ